MPLQHVYRCTYKHGYFFDWAINSTLQKKAWTMWPSNMHLPWTATCTACSTADIMWHIRLSIVLLTFNPNIHVPTCTYNTIQCNIWQVSFQKIHINIRYKAIFWLIELDNVLYTHHLTSAWNNSEFLGVYTRLFISAPILNYLELLIKVVIIINLFSIVT